jgi:chromosomal replication initiator protein
VSKVSGDIATSLWERCLGQLQSRLSPATIRTWLAPARPVSIDGDGVVIAVPNSFVEQRIREGLIDPLTEVISEVAGIPRPKLTFVVDPDMPLGDMPVAFTSGPASPGVETASTPGAASTTGDPSPGLGIPPTSTGPDGALRAPRPSLSHKYSFDNFVVGDSNRLAHHAARAVAEQPAQVYNPLFIYGGAGLGKTHLLHAIGLEVYRFYSNKRIEYVTSESFISEFIMAIQYDRTDRFKQRYRSVDVLLVDDIQFLANSEKTQEEFFHTFNALYNEDKQMVISSDQPPSQIGSLESRLRTRFSLGLTADIQAPDFETRVAILRKYAAAHRVPLPDEVLTYIANLFTGNIRELQGALTRVVASATLDGVPITLKLAERELQSQSPRALTARPIHPGDIIAEVASYFGVTPEDLASPARHRGLVTARHVAIYLCRSLTDLSLPQIGELFGGRDHTTVLHSLKKIESLLKEKRSVYDQVSELSARLRSRA